MIAARPRGRGLGPAARADPGRAPAGSAAPRSVTCEGSTPSDGVNCNAGAGGSVDAGNTIQGSVDLIQAYCKALPAKAKPGTAAIPRANIQLVVTDNTGAQDGPFDLGLNRRCPPAPDVAPAAKSKKTKKTTKKTKKTDGK